MPKISQLPSDASPASTDYVAGVQAGVPGTVRFLLSSLATFFWTLANIPSGATSPITRDNETQFAFVASGLVWTGDSYGVNRNASMTAGVVYINGRRISISAVTARTFTASKDTYIDILDNGDGTGTLVYTEATNNAASPALAANSIRIGIIVTGATTIAAAGSVNQGQELRVLPIASSIPYQVTDSLGNLICNRDPSSKLLGQRIVTSNQTTTSGTYADVTGLNLAVNIPANRKIEAYAHFGEAGSTVDGSGIKVNITDVTSSTQIAEDVATAALINNQFTVTPMSGAITPPASGVRNYKVQFGLYGGAATISSNGSATSPITLVIKLI